MRAEPVSSDVLRMRISFRREGLISEFLSISDLFEIETKELFSCGNNQYSQLGIEQLGK